MFNLGQLQALLRSLPLSGSRRYRVVQALLLAASVVVSGCGGSSGGDGGTPPTVLVPANGQLTKPAAFVSLTVVDAQSGAPIEESTVTLSGEGASQAVNPLGATVSQLKVVNGTGFFNLKAAAVPTANAPIVIQLGVVSKGYLSSGALLSIAKNGKTEREIRLVRASFNGSGDLTSAPAGVRGKQEMVDSSADGSLRSNSADGSFTLSVPASSTLISVTTSSGITEQVAAPSASISIPAGVKVGRLVTSAAGVSTFTPAAAGPITARVVSFSPQSAEALRSFPGGFGVLPSAGGGITAPSIFQTAGFAAFEFTDAAGNPVDRFTGSVSMTVEAPSATVTPEGVPFAIGTAVPIWSYNASIADWKFESTSRVIGKAINGNWIVSFSSNHLSFWNMDYYGTSCSIGNLNIVGRGGDRRPLIYELTAVGGKFWSMETGVDVEDSVELSFVPSDRKVTITAYDPATGINVQVGKVADVAFSCDGTPVDVRVSLSPLPAPRLINIKTVESCSDGSNARPLAAWVYSWLGAGFSNYTNNDGVVTQETYLTVPVDVFAYDVYRDIFYKVSLPAAGPGTTQDANFLFDLSCTNQPAPTKPTGGTGGAGGSGGFSGSGAN